MKNYKRIMIVIICIIIIGVGFTWVKKSAMKVTGEEQSAAESRVTHAATEKYKDMNYSFLKDYEFGEADNNDVNVIFENVEDMLESEDVRLRAGNKVRTQGYYEAGDKGGAVYQISNKQERGGMQLKNGLYVNILPDTKDINGKKWCIISIKQLGAKGDGTNPDNTAINETAGIASECVAASEDIERGIVYMPEGEYKCTDIVSLGVHNLNIVGEGEDTVLFTDNDYRKESGYSEFFIEVWGGVNTFISSFRVEAREVDLYHYMRQFVVLYSTDIYMYDVDLIVPQEAYSAYYYEDKQYSNFCCYTGNKNVTVDDCTMVQMSGTYRGANVGILDIWSTGEENIVVMNCDIYGNARDEQIGVFSTEKESAYVKNVEFINNDVYFYQPKYVDVVGNATMRITIGYSDSKNVDNIRLAGNHFIAECDSKFITFGAVTNCVIEDNIMEVLCTYATWSIVFDSSNGDAKNILIKDNEIFLTSNEGKGKGNLIGGKLTFENNRLFSDVQILFGVLGDNVRNNEMIFLKNISKLADSPKDWKNNTVYMYDSFGSSIEIPGRPFLTMDGTKEDEDYEFSGNIIYDYKRQDEVLGTFVSLCRLNSSFNTFTFANNRYLTPNVRYTSSQFSPDVPAGTDEQGDYYYNRLFRYRAGTYKNIIVANNVLQGTAISLPGGDTVFNQYGNTIISFEEDLSEELVSHIDMTKDGKTVTEITTTADNIKLDEMVYIAAERDSEGNVVSEKKVDNKEIRWYSSVESMASVSQDGNVVRKKYGDVKIYAVPLDGSNVYGECIIHFEKAKVTDVVINKEELELQPGYRMYADYTVLPDKEASRNLIWSSEDESVATVSESGLIEAKALGSTVITCKTNDGSNITKQIKVNVTEITVKKITLNEWYVQVPVTDIGKTHQLEVTEYYPSTAVNKEVGRWESSDESVVSVDKNGLVKINSSGVAKITVYSNDEKCCATCKFYVQLPVVTGVTASADKNSIKLNWNEDQKANGYFVYAYNRETGEYDKLAELKTKDTKYTASGLDSGTEYIYSIRSFIKNYGNGECYESDEYVIKAKTFDYVPVNSYFGIPNPIECLVEGGNDSSVYWFTYSPYENVYENLKINCKVDDESIAKVSEFYKADDLPNKYYYKIKPISAGITKLVISSNDKKGTVYEIPVGIFPKSAKKYNYDSIKGNVEYQKLTITFDGLEDESGIAGYMVRRTQTMIFNDLEFIPKQGDGTKYTYIQTKDIKDGAEYRYTVVPVMSDGTTYFRMYDTKWINVAFPNPIEVENIELDKEIYNVPIDTTMGMSAKITPDDVSYKDLIFTVMNSKLGYAEKKETTNNINYAVINPKKTGMTTIEVAAADNSNVKKYAKVVFTPEKINSVNIAPMSNAVRLVWEGIEDADGYFVYRFNETTDKWDTVADLRTTEFTDNGLVNDTTYRYKVAGYIIEDNVKYEGSVSDDVNAKTFLGAFDIPVSGYEGVYDGKEHNAVIFGCDIPEDDMIMYSTDYKNWSNVMPSVKYVKDTQTIYIKEIKSDESEYTTSVNIIIKKSGITPNMPEETMYVENKVNSIEKITLKAGWEWQIGENSQLLAAGKTSTFTAVYVGEDKGNYTKENVEIAITREKCKMNNTTLKNEISATCTKSGYTGDYICNECGEVVKYGSKVNALGHKWDSGKVVKDATETEKGMKLYICTECKEEKYEEIPQMSESETSEDVTTDDTTKETTTEDIKTEKDTTMDKTSGEVITENTTAEIEDNDVSYEGNSEKLTTENKSKFDRKENVKTGDSGIMVIGGVTLLGMISVIVYSAAKKKKGIR